MADKSANVRPMPSGTTCTSDVISARTAFIDFYGNYAVSFSSQFVASIFGLITLCALVNVVMISIDKQFNPLSVVVIIFSMLMFIGFTLAARHTYSRFKYYSDLASKLINNADCLLNVAQLGETKTYFKVRDNEKKIRELEETYLELKEKLPENYKESIHEYERIEIPFCQYEKINRFNQNKSSVKKILDKTRFPLLLGLGVIGLALVTYYPLLVNFLKFIGLQV